MAEAISAKRARSLLLIWGLAMWCMPAPMRAEAPPEPTPTFAPSICSIGGDTSLLLSSSTFVLDIPMSGAQTMRCGPPDPDGTRPMVIAPEESHFECNTFTLAGLPVRVCPRMDATAYCQSGPFQGYICQTLD